MVLGLSCIICPNCLTVDPFGTLMQLLLRLSAVTHVMALVCSEPELMLGQISNLADLIREKDGKGDAESEYKQKESELKIKL